MGCARVEELNRLCVKAREIPFTQGGRSLLFIRLHCDCKGVVAKRAGDFLVPVSLSEKNSGGCFLTNSLGYVVREEGRVGSD